MHQKDAILVQPTISCKQLQIFLQRQAYWVWVLGNINSTSSGHTTAKLMFIYSIA